MSDEVKQVVVVVPKVGNVMDDDADEYEVKFKSTQEGQKDVEILKQLLITKSSYLGSSIKAGQVAFKRESELRAGKWVTIGEKSPIKDRSVVMCCVTKPMKPIQLDMTNGELFVTSRFVLLNN